MVRVDQTDLLNVAAKVKEVAEEFSMGIDDKASMIERLMNATSELYYLAGVAAAANAEK